MVRSLLTVAPEPWPFPKQLSPGALGVSRSLVVSEPPSSLSPSAMHNSLYVSALTSFTSPTVAAYMLSSEVVCAKHFNSSNVKALARFCQYEYGTKMMEMAHFRWARTTYLEELNMLVKLSILSKIIGTGLALVRHGTRLGPRDSS